MTPLADLNHVIMAAARGADRSQQVSIGPSEIGQSCERRLAMGLLGSPKVNEDRDEWTAAVGTACHAWMEDAFRADNARRDAAGQMQRWLIEQTVHIRTGLAGHCDLFDLETMTVIDHKFPGVTSIRKYRSKGHPGQQYAWQAHLYGMGWANAGVPVKNVQLIMWPRSGLIRDAWTWSEPYNPEIAAQALARVDALLAGMNVSEHMGRLEDFFMTLERDTEFCSWCAFFDQTVADPTQGCRGPYYDEAFKDPKTMRVAGIL